MDYGDVVSVPDDAPAEVSYARQLRMVDELYEALKRNLPGVDHDYAIACARNLASGWGYFGAVANHAHLVGGCDGVVQR